MTFGQLVLRTSLSDRIKYEFIRYYAVPIVLFWILIAVLIVKAVVLKKIAIIRKI